MAGENIQVLKLNAEKLGKEIERTALEVVKQKAIWIEIRKDEINKSEQLKKELEYLSECVLAEYHRIVFERILPKILPLEKIEPEGQYEESFCNENGEEEVWLTERWEFDIDVQFNNEYYGSYVIIEKHVFGDVWDLELFVPKKIEDKNKVKYLILREDLEYLTKYYTFKDLEILENLKLIIQ